MGERGYPVVVSCGKASAERRAPVAPFDERRGAHCHDGGGFQSKGTRWLRPMVVGTNVGILSNSHRDIDAESAIYLLIEAPLLGTSFILAGA
jgi:hypothetical protein